MNVQLVRNNLIIATVKTSAADLVAQCVIERKPITEVDWKRNLATWLPGCHLFWNCEQYCSLSVSL